MSAGKTTTPCEIRLLDNSKLAPRARQAMKVFVTEGMMAAFPLCFPKQTAPIAPDESYITALTHGPDHSIYGGTSARLGGREAHLFAALFHGVTGAVVDMGILPAVTETVAVCFAGGEVVALANGFSGGRVFLQAPLAPPFDLIQEWFITIDPLEDLPVVFDGEAIVHAVGLPDGDRVAIATERALFILDVPTRTIEMAGACETSGRLAVTASGCVVGCNGGDALWEFDPAAGRLRRKAHPLPLGYWEGAQLVWGRDARDGTLYTADADGMLFSFHEGVGFSPPLGRAPAAPVNALALTCDGRLFGHGGAEMGRLFRWNPGSGEMRDLGVAVSTLERRRYGYVFADALTGRDGQIYFAENDGGGHLWLYFPRIEFNTGPV